MKKFKFRIYQNGDEDGDNIWEEAETREIAEWNIRREYHSIDELVYLGELK